MTPESQLAILASQGYTLDRLKSLEFDANDRAQPADGYAFARLTTGFAGSFASTGPVGVILVHVRIADLPNFRDLIRLTPGYTLVVYRTNPLTHTAETTMSEHQNQLKLISTFITTAAECPAGATRYLVQYGPAARPGRCTPLEALTSPAEVYIDVPDDKVSTFLAAIDSLPREIAVVRYFDHKPSASGKGMIWCDPSTGRIAEPEAPPPMPDEDIKERGGDPNVTTIEEEIEMRKAADAFAHRQAPKPVQRVVATDPPTELPDGIYTAPAAAVAQPPDFDRHVRLRAIEVRLDPERTVLPAAPKRAAPAWFNSTATSKPYDGAACMVWGASMPEPLAANYDDKTMEWDVNGFRYHVRTMSHWAYGDGLREPNTKAEKADYADLTQADRITLEELREEIIKRNSGLGMPRDTTTVLAWAMEALKSYAAPAAAPMPDTQTDLDTLRGRETKAEMLDARAAEIAKAFSQLSVADRLQSLQNLQADHPKLHFLVAVQLQQTGCTAPAVPAGRQHYVVIDRTSLAILGDDVNQRIANGWQPIGGITLGKNGDYLQAMIHSPVVQLPVHHGNVGQMLLGGK